MCGRGEIQDRFECIFPFFTTSLLKGYLRGHERNLRINNIVSIEIFSSQYREMQINGRREYFPCCLLAKTLRDLSSTPLYFSDCRTGETIFHFVRENWTLGVRIYKLPPFFFCCENSYCETKKKTEKCFSLKEGKCWKMD